MNLDDVSRFISSVGFPCTVCIYVLWRLEDAMLKIQKAVVELTEKLDSLFERRAP